jgi:hypothetical protein
MSGREPVKIDDTFEQEARAMARAMDTGELPPDSAPYYQRVRGLAELHWQERNQREQRGFQGGRP